MKYIFSLIFLFSLHSLDAMNYRKLTAEEVESIATNRQLQVRLLQEGQHVREQLGEEDFQRLMQVWTGADIARVDQMHREVIRTTPNQETFYTENPDLVAFITAYSVTTMLEDKSIPLGILEFCGLAMQKWNQERAQRRARVTNQQID